MDGALLAHPLVAEAVAFGAPDEKYGEVVAAAVVLSRPADDHDAVVRDIQKQTATRVASFKVCMCLGALGERDLTQHFSMFHPLRGSMSSCWESALRRPSCAVQYCAV